MAKSFCCFVILSAICFVWATKDAPSTILELRTCMDEKQQTCTNTCKDKLPSGDSKHPIKKEDLFKCFEDRRNVKRDQHEKCFIAAGIKGESPCYKRPSHLVPWTCSSVGNPGGCRIISSNLFAELDQFQTCKKECKKGAKEKCSSGCTAEIDEKTKQNLLSCYNPQTKGPFEQIDDKFYTCALKAGLLVPSAPD